MLTRLALALLLVAFSSQAAGPAPAPAASAAPPPAAAAPALPAPVASVEGIREYRLANGMRVLLFPDPTKATVTVNVTYFVGSKHEGYGETGMAHLLEHLLFKGTPTTPDVPQALTERGARPNGTTWLDRTNYFETLPASEANLQWALGFEADRMVNSFVRASDLASEMTVVRNELERGENDPHGVLFERMMSSAFLWHNYGKSTIGARADLEHVPIERLQAFYRTYYQPDNAMLVVAGRFEPQRALELAQATFGKLPRPKRALPHSYTEEPVQDGEREVTLRRVGEVGLVGAVYHVPEGAHPDFAAIDVLTEIMGSAPSGRLYKALVETKKAASAGAFNYQLQDPGVLAFSAELRAGAPLAPARAALLETVEGAAKAPFTAEEVSRAKTTLLKGIELTLNNSERAAILMSEWAAIGDWRMLFLHRDRIEAVKPEDVTRVAQDYLKQSNRTLGEFVPTPKPDRAPQPPHVDVAKMLEGYKGRAEVAQGEAFDPSPASVEARVKRSQLPGGLKLALLSKRTRGQMVNVQLSLHFGTLEAVKGKSDAADYAGAMLMRGTQKHSRQELKDLFDKLKARVGVGGGALGASAFIETTRENLPAVLRLVAEVLQQPAFDPKEFGELQQAWLASAESQRSEPDAQGYTAYRRTLLPYPKGHPFYVPTLQENIDNLQRTPLAEARAFYKEFYGADHAELAAVGDFDEKALAQLAGELFGRWKSPRPYVRVPGEFKDVPAQTKVLETPDKANAVFLAGQNLRLRDDDPDYPALVLGNFLLGGGFLNSRLATRVRQKEGLSYGVSSSLTASALDPVGAFFTNAIYAPENAQRLETAVREELQRVLDAGFTKEELEKGRAGLLEYRQSGRAQDAGLARQLSGYLFLGRTLQWDAELERRIAQLTPKDVQEALRRHIDPAKLTVVRAGDFAGAKARSAEGTPVPAAGRK
ncbi:MULTISPECIES: pitrilysin family protein [Myxococcaceae]|uniref:M16 family metallopeptidase n=1 Tax=Myxococcaceae TaxID=31 RepID=UPI001E483AA6|nr:MULTISPECIES: pitrilysin family protein [Myxococcaceae]